MQWEGKFGPAFVATVVFAFIQLGAVIFGAGMIWSDVKKTQIVTTQLAEEHHQLTKAVQEAKVENVKREGIVDTAIGEIKSSMLWMTQIVQRLESRVDGPR